MNFVADRLGMRDRGDDERQITEVLCEPWDLWL